MLLVRLIDLENARVLIKRQLGIFFLFRKGNHFNSKCCPVFLGLYPFHPFTWKLSKHIAQQKHKKLKSQQGKNNSPTPSIFIHLSSDVFHPNLRMFAGQP